MTGPLTPREKWDRSPQTSAEGPREHRRSAEVFHGRADRGHAPGGRADRAPLGAAGCLDASDSAGPRRQVRARGAAAVAGSEAASRLAFVQASAKARRAECCVVRVPALARQPTARLEAYARCLAHRACAAFRAPAR